MDQLDAEPETPPDASGRTGLLARAQVPLGQLGLVALGLYVTIEAQSLGLWTTLGPGPGLLPLILGIALLGLTAVWIVQTIVARRRGADEAADPHVGERLDRPYALGIVGGLILLAALMDLLGFQISMAVFLFVELIWLGRQKWWLARSSRSSAASAPSCCSTASSGWRCRCRRCPCCQDWGSEMNVLMELANGFATALTLQNLSYALIGCLVGTLIGVLPGIGPVAGVALLIPLTLNLEPTGAIIMLAAIFYGTAYGGTITSVLLNTPRRGRLGDHHDRRL